jgi:hypothetical protein
LTNLLLLLLSTLLVVLSGLLSLRCHCLRRLLCRGAPLVLLLIAAARCRGHLAPHLLLLLLATLLVVLGSLLSLLCPCLGRRLLWLGTALVITLVL